MTRQGKQAAAKQPFVFLRVITRKPSAKADKALRQQRVFESMKEDEENKRLRSRRKTKIMKVIIVEDNPAIVKGLVYPLEKEGYEVKAFASAKEVRAYFAEAYYASEFGGTEDGSDKRKKDFDDDENRDACILILDVGLPDGDGFKLYERIISPLNIPTIFLTAKDEEDDVVHGFELGAEDYVTKPFSTRELIQRIRRIAARLKKDTLIRIRDITYDMDKMELKRAGEIIELSSLELKIFHLLISNLNHVVSRNLMLEKIWEWTGNDVDDHTVTVYLKRIRQKLKTDIITTVKGVGYRIDQSEI